MKNRILPFILFLISISASDVIFGQGCEGIISISCGNSIAFNPGTGQGSATFPNGLGTGCYSNSGLGGLEQVYQFIAPEDGTYQIQTLTTNTGIVEYFYKNGNQILALELGGPAWIYQSSIQLDAINLMTNDSIWIIANAESSSSTPNQNFQINCVVPFACTNITEITCGTAVNFSVGAGYGDPLFSNGLGSSCYNNSGQGGSETIYHFEANSSGTYNFQRSVLPVLLSLNISTNLTQRSLQCNRLVMFRLCLRSKHSFRWYQSEQRRWHIYSRKQ
jgi:hypothetical protein